MCKRKNEQIREMVKVPACVGPYLMGLSNVKENSGTGVRRK